MYLAHIYIKHYRLITDQLDVIKNVNIKWLNDTKQCYPIMNRFHYLFVLLTMNYFTMDMLFVTYQHCVLETECANLINSTRFIPHRLFPQTFWYQGDFIFIISKAMAITNFFILLFTKSLNPKFCFYVIDKMNDNNTIHLYDYKRKMVPTSITEKMIRYRLIGRKIINQLTVGIFFIIYIYFLQQVWINSYYQINELIFYCLILPIVLFYFIVGVILLISFCVITIKYVQVCQWYIIDQCFNRVNKKVRKNDKNKIYLLNRITKPMVQICSSISSYNQFWSPILTTDFIGYSLANCYLIYSLYFKQSSAFEKYFFIIFAIFDAIVLTYFIQECTKITRNNTKIEYKLRCYLLKLLWSRKTSSQLKFKVSFVSYNIQHESKNCFLFFKVELFYNEPKIGKVWIHILEPLANRFKLLSFCNKIKNELFYLYIDKIDFYFTGFLHYNRIFYANI